MSTKYGVSNKVYISKGVELPGRGVGYTRVTQTSLQNYVKSLSCKASIFWGFELKRDILWCFRMKRIFVCKTARFDRLGVAVVKYILIINSHFWQLPKKYTIYGSSAIEVLITASGEKIPNKSTLLYCLSGQIIIWNTLKLKI